MSIIHYTITTIIAALVLFHSYGSRDTAAIVCLVLAVYGLVMAQISTEGMMSATYYLQLSRRLPQTVNDDQQKGTLDDLVDRDRPHTLFHVLFHLTLSAVAVARLLFILFT